MSLRNTSSKRAASQRKGVTAMATTTTKLSLLARPLFGAERTLSRRLASDAGGPDGWTRAEEFSWFQPMQTRWKVRTQAVCSVTTTPRKLCCWGFIIFLLLRTTASSNTWALTIVLHLLWRGCGQVPEDQRLWVVGERTAAIHCARTLVSLFLSKCF